MWKLCQLGAKVMHTSFNVRGGAKHNGRFIRRCLSVRQTSVEASKGQPGDTLEEMDGESREE